LCDQEVDQRTVSSIIDAIFEVGDRCVEAPQGYISSYQNMGAEKKILAKKSLNKSNESINDIEKAICKVPKSRLDVSGSKAEVKGVPVFFKAP